MTTENPFRALPSVDHLLADVRLRPLTQVRRTTRTEALERIRGRFISTLQLLPEDEFRAGAEQAARELPEQVEYAIEWAIVVAERR